MLMLFSAFKEVAKLVYTHASKIQPERIVLLFRHAMLHLFKYLTFDPL